MDYRAEFLEIFQQKVSRPGSEKLLAWLDTTDFFRAPASTRFHGACESGLVMHSLNVYHALMDRFFEEGDNPESMAICGLLHDVCKIGFYRPDFRNVKEDGQWVRKPCYVRDEVFPFGHGEKSVFIIGRYIHLTAEEAMAINWHMGGFDARARGGDRSVSEAFGKYPLAVLLHVADLEATYLDEKHG